MKQLTTEIIAICDYATISREGKVSIMGIFDELRAQKFPTGLAKGFFVATLSGAPNTVYKLSLKIENENNKEVMPSLNMDIKTGDSGKNNMVIELIGAKFDKEGTYRFKIYQDSVGIGSTELKLVHVREAKKQEVPN